MPASVCDPVSNALRLSLSSEHNSNSDVLDNRLIASAKSVLLSNIDFEESGNYQSDLLDGLKTKYVVIRPKKLSSDIKISKNEASDTSLAAGCRQDCKLPTPKHVLFPSENVTLGWTGKDFQVGSGMVNVGNTCYLNSTLQALFHVPAFANWLMSDFQHVNKCNHSDNCITCSVRSTLLATQRCSSPIKPWQVYSKLRLICRHLTPGRQEDAHEFLRYLVEAMEKSFLSRCSNLASQLDQYSKETTPLNQILGGYLRSAVRCLACGHVSTTFQHFQDLLLDIRKAATIDEALDTFFSRERLEDLGYKCEACNKKVSATKQFFIERAPAVLCVALKRFSLGSGKLSRHISCRLNLSLNKYIFHKNKNLKLNYRLVALVTHLGTSQNCGHYTAIGRASNGLYYQFDDTCVRNLPLSAVLATNAYIMFYELEKTTQNNAIITKEILQTTTSEQSSQPVIYGPKLPDNFIPQKQNTITKSTEQNLHRGADNLPNHKQFASSIASTSKSILKNGDIVNANNVNVLVHNIDKTKNNFHNINDTSLEKNGSASFADNHHNVTKNGEELRTQINGNIPKVLSKDYCRDGYSTAKPAGSKFHWEMEKRSSSVCNEKNSNSVNYNRENRVKRDSKSPSNKSCSKSASSSFSDFKCENNSLPDINATNSSRLVPYEAESSDEDEGVNNRNNKKNYVAIHKTSHSITSTLNSWTVSIDKDPKLHPSRLATYNKLSTEESAENKTHISDRCLTESKLESMQNNTLGSHQTLNHLHQLSHRGYGAPVQTWNGTRAHLSKEVLDEKRFERKRGMNSVDEIDSGRVKKICTYNKFNNFQKNRYNPFQDKQNRHHNGYWSKDNNHFNGNSQDRRPFYHQYPRNNGHNQYRYRHKYHNNYPRHR